MTSILIRYTDARIWIWYDMKWHMIPYDMKCYYLNYDMTWYDMYHDIDIDIDMNVDMNVDILILIWYWHWYDMTFLWWIFLQQHRQHNPPFILFTASNQEHKQPIFMSVCWNNIFICTLPVANIAPEHGWLEDENSWNGMPYFRCYVCFRECIDLYSSHQN